METSTAERYAGMNVSYENSFTAIKKDILKETVDKKRIAALTKEVIPIEEKPNKPKDKLMIKNMNGSIEESMQGHLNLTQEVKPVTVEELLGKTGSHQYASSLSGRKQQQNSDFKNNTQMVNNHNMLIQDHPKSSLAESSLNES